MRLWRLLLRMVVCAYFAAFLVCVTSAQCGERIGDLTCESQGGALELRLIHKRQAQFYVELQNTSDHALILNLGMMLGNGSKQYADRIHLLLNGLDGKELQLELIGPATINGRLDPLVVPLPPGSTFSLPIDLRSYFAPKERVWKLLLPAGQYTLVAQYAGAGVSQAEANLDMKGIALMPFWSGAIESNSVKFNLTRSLEEISRTDK